MSQNQNKLTPDFPTAGVVEHTIPNQTVDSNYVQWRQRCTQRSGWLRNALSLITGWRGYEAYQSEVKVTPAPNAIAQDHAAIDFTCKEENLVGKHSNLISRPSQHAGPRDLRREMPEKTIDISWIGLNGHKTDPNRAGIYQRQSLTLDEKLHLPSELCIGDERMPLHAQKQFISPDKANPFAYQICEPVSTLSVVCHAALQPGVMDLVNCSIAELYLMVLSCDDVNGFRYKRLFMDDVSPATKWRITPELATIRNWEAIEQRSWRVGRGLSVNIRTEVFNDREKNKVLLNALNEYCWKYYGIKGEIMPVERTAHCLIRTTDTPIPNQPEGAERTFFGLDRVQFCQTTLSKIVAYFDTRYISFDGYPLLDMTNYLEPVSINVPWFFKDIMELNSALEVYGLQIVTQKALVPCIRLYEPEYLAERTGAHQSLIRQTA